jgi:hypothetical protein
MSRKSVSIVVPRKDAAASAESLPAPVASDDARGVDSGVESWVSQAEVRQDEPASSGALTLTIPAEPDWTDLAQSLLVPHVVFWSWTVNRAKKNLAFFL